MLETLLIGGLASVVIAIVAALVILRMQQRGLDRTLAQQQAWERAQDVRQLQWKVQQERRAIELEKKLTSQVQQVYTDWQAWEAHDAMRVEALRYQYDTATNKS